MRVPTSQHRLQGASCKPTDRSIQIVKMCWRSLPTLEVFFFEGNFFENTTPLVILDICLNCAINLMLLAKQIILYDD